ncbi:GNAT family N-acetyltransferase [Streptomyces sp. 3MP-14]|uniref:Lysine N-acyltransferase MbtK n=1 Tax=Streptomyces mimosae TaxID=2586635 RepID=A0A5N5ZMZ5_9ACTN|nr:MULTISPECIES: GNAT family N-acetyltransferase [Streptomyces]KAB8157867.1 GNAT family N-acetyltransferase [Streptomyces mimosae]KAB8172304.1 GNAT family N-acetyltransferase [Streptomyces sp. 3MP-14]
MRGQPFTRSHPELGTFTLRPVDPAVDCPLLHRWLTHPKAVYWMMTDAQLGDVVKEYETIDADPGRAAHLGHHRDAPAFLVETYDPAGDPVGATYPVREGDIGMHFLVAPTDAPIHGFTLAVIETVMELLFADPANRRVVVEPDAGNHAVHRLNEAVGFLPERTVELPDKTGLLSFCTREQYRATTSQRHPGAAR